MSLIERGFLLSFFCSLFGLFWLSYLLFWTLFSLNSSKFRGFSPYFLHFSRYCFYISSIATLLLSIASCFALCLFLSASNTSFCLRISSTSLDSFTPSSFFSFLSMSFSCLRLTILRFLMSSLSYRICASLRLTLLYSSSRSSAVNLFLLVFFCNAFSSFW